MASEAEEPAFDPVIHAPARLKIMMLLASTTTGTFNALADDAKLTAGNLATHLKHLENAGYVESFTRLVDLKPRKRYQLTDAGRDALRAYLHTLKATVASLQDVVDER